MLSLIHILYEYGFSAYPARTCAVRGQALTQASVSGGVSPTVPLIAGAGFCYPAAETERLTTRICLDGPLRAPVPAGKTVGAAVFCLNGTEIGRVPLVAGRTVMPKVSSALDVYKRQVYENLDRGMLMGLEMTIDEMTEMGNPVHHATV